MKSQTIWLCVLVAAVVFGVRFLIGERLISEQAMEPVVLKPSAEKTRATVEELPTEMERRAGREALSPPAAGHDFLLDRAVLHQRYDVILAQLGLSAAQAERFVDLKLSIRDAHKDLNAVLDQEGMRGDTPGAETLRSQLTKPMWDEIRQLFPEDRFSSFWEHEQMLGFRPMVAAHFATSRVHVSAQQVDQITQLSIKNSLTGLEYPTHFYAWKQVDWAPVVRDSEKILTPEQHAVILALAAREEARRSKK